MDLRDLPRVDVLAERLAADSSLPRTVLTLLARRSIDEARRSIRGGSEADAAAIATEAARSLERSRARVVINATGVLLHTNLGRAPLHMDDAGRAEAVGSAYSNVELDDRGGRGRRGGYVAELLTALTGAEAALVVNNNAGALLLALAALTGRGGRVAVARGELIEIGGSFRLPELIEAGGVRLVEVGTTNRTRRSDYERVAGAVDAILKVHPSNYRIEGFTEEASYEELALIAGGCGVPLIADLGSGLLDASTPWLDAVPNWLIAEPAIRQTIQEGATVVLASGDKLLGGPQAGIAVGGQSAIARMASHPLARALRCDGPTIAALEATLERYAGGTGATIPFWHMAVLPSEELERRCARVIELAGVGRVAAGESLPGAGSAPGQTIPTPIIEITGDAEGFFDRLLTAGILATRRDGAVHVNLRAVDPADDVTVARALR